MHRRSTIDRPKQSAAVKAVAADSAASKAVWAAAVLAIAAAFVAAGSTGLLAHGLRHAITWVLLLLVAALAWPVGAGWREKAIVLVASAAAVVLTAVALAAVALAAVALTVSTIPAVNVFAVSLLVSALALAHVGSARAMLFTAAQGSGVLALFQLGQSSIATFWQASNAVAGAVGAVGGEIAGEPLNVGSTFAEAPRANAEHDPDRSGGDHQREEEERHDVAPRTGL